MDDTATPRSSRQRSERPTDTRARTGGLRWLTLVLALLLLGTMLPPAALADDIDTTDRIRQMLEDGSSNATVGVYLKEVGGPVHASYNASFVFEPASTIKALIHFHAMRQVQDGTVIDGLPVTLSRQIPWLADASKFDGLGNYVPGGVDCPTDNTENQMTTLATTLQWMMVPSDNATTQGLRDFFGDGQIDATRQALGMDDTAINHTIGCGGPPDNELTLVDAGKLYEAVATGYLTDPNPAYQLMLTDANRFNAIIDSEAAGLGLSLATLNEFKAQRRSALKAGAYTIGGQDYRSVAGWAEFGFKDGNCAVVPRSFVNGAFIHASDAAPTANIRTVGAEVFREQIQNALASWVACEADLEVVATSFIDPPSEIDVNTSVTFTVRHVVRNNGPAPTVDADLTTVVGAPPDCTVQPEQTDQVVPALASGAQVAVDVTVDVTCGDPSSHLLTADAVIAPSNPAVHDPVGGNEAGNASATVAVIAYADLAVLDLDLAQLDGAGYGDLLVGETFIFDAPVTLHNLGDTVKGLYHDPADADLSRTLTVPDGITGSVFVTGAEAPATIVVEEHGQAPVVHANQPAGTEIAIAGPATLLVHSVDALMVGADRVLEARFGLSCDAPGLHDIDLAAEVSPADPHVLDPNASNDVLEVSRTIDCVTPVQINVRPGNAHNYLSPQGAQSVPTAVLTTETGEYGLPLGFDATTIDHTTVRFGATSTLDAGDGSSPHPDRGFVRDSFEMDDLTKDGDHDMVLLFTTTGTGLDQQSSEACVAGAYEGDGGTLLSFYGCDTVQVPPGG